MSRLLRSATHLYDRMALRWEGTRCWPRVGSALVITFLAALVAIERRRRHLLPAAFSALVPENHFYAVNLAFSLLLLVEVVSLVFTLASSVAISVGKQLEIFSLILLRETFKQFTAFPEPVTWSAVAPHIPAMLADMTGALAVFALLAFYYRAQRHQAITPSREDQESFVATKKLIALALLGLFAAVGLHHSWVYLATGTTYGFFEVIYTVLILSDVLLVLVALRSSNRYWVVFRNSGFAATTVLVRLALVAPPILNAALGVAAACLALAFTLAYNTFSRTLHQG
ncbi:MAG: hypothetical protein NZ869_00925 [Thermoanaerobaculum sp.]|nr:hypothetical protein [Thermoanaerobaculum sp.]MDW7966849.1 hypothetical protein [Thermoanaerobaculum sp.]